tara:strand:+ start:179 stop:565 length:387 start_codon:yes stop_codon:yes gene_type:complete
MASILKVNTLTGASTAGSIAVTGEGNSTTTNLQQGLCKAWAYYTTASSFTNHDSFNISGLADAGTGDCRMNFTNVMSSENRPQCGMSGHYHHIDGDASASFGGFNSYNDSHAQVDTSRSSGLVFGDLA